MVAQVTLDHYLRKNELVPHEKPSTLYETFTIFEVPNFLLCFFILIIH